MNENTPPPVYKMPRLGLTGSRAESPRAKLIDMPNDTLFTVDEVAVFMGCSKPSVEREIYSRKMKSARVAGGRRIKKEWVMEYIDKQCSELK